MHTPCCRLLCNLAMRKQVCLLHAITPASLAAHLVDVGQCTLTGELHRIDLHSRASLNDLILIAQRGHIEHEGLSRTNELVVHLGAEKAHKAKTNKTSCLVVIFFNLSFCLILCRLFRVPWPSCHVTATASTRSHPRPVVMRMGNAVHTHNSSSRKVEAGELRT